MNPAANEFAAHPLFENLAGSPLALVLFAVLALGAFALVLGRLAVLHPILPRTPFGWLIALAAGLLFTAVLGLFLPASLVYPFTLALVLVAAWATRTHWLAWLRGENRQPHGARERS